MPSAELKMMRPALAVISPVPRALTSVAVMVPRVRIRSPDQPLLAPPRVRVPVYMLPPVSVLTLSTVMLPEPLKVLLMVMERAVSVSVAELALRILMSVGPSMAVTLL